MPAIQRGQAYKLGRGRWGLRYYDRDGVRRRTKEKFPSKSAALQHYRDVIEPQLRGEPAPADRPDTFADLVPVYLARHAASVRRRTIGSAQRSTRVRRLSTHASARSRNARRGSRRSTCANAS